jgi:branched-chain amino acid transport system permease protein
MFKEAGLTAFVALMLALPMAGFETVGTSVGLDLHFRPLFVVIPVVVVFVGRLLLILLRSRHRVVARNQATESIMDRVARGVSTYAAYIGPLVFLFAVVLPFLPFSSRYFIDIATSVLIYIMLGVVTLLTLPPRY